MQKMRALIVCCIFGRWASVWVERVVRLHPPPQPTARARGWVTVTRLYVPQDVQIVSSVDFIFVFIFFQLHRYRAHHRDQHRGCRGTTSPSKHANVGQHWHVY